MPNTAKNIHKHDNLILPNGLPNSYADQWRVDTSQIGDFGTGVIVLVTQHDLPPHNQLETHQLAPGLSITGNHPVLLIPTATSSPGFNGNLQCPKETVSVPSNDVPVLAEATDEDTGCRSHMPYLQWLWPMEIVSTSTPQPHLTCVYNIELDDPTCAILVGDDAGDSSSGWSYQVACATLGQWCADRGNDSFCVHWSENPLREHFLSLATDKQAEITAGST